MCVCYFRILEFWTHEDTQDQPRLLLKGYNNNIVFNGLPQGGSISLQYIGLKVPISRTSLSTLSIKWFHSSFIPSLRCTFLQMPHLMSWIREIFRGGITDPPPSDLRLSVSWMNPGVNERNVTEAEAIGLLNDCDHQLKGFLFLPGGPKLPGVAFFFSLLSW